jgi:hypothetical protein
LNIGLKLNTARFAKVDLREAPWTAAAAATVRAGLKEHHFFRFDEQQVG